ncbi:MAG: metallophosphoesterase family protein [Alphaproteobacteria bacterium]
MAFTLAHISDLHLPPPEPLTLAQLLGKRAIGYNNWRLSRSKLHRPATLEKLIRDLKAQSPDHTVVTGDLVNFATREEFTSAAQWLKDFGTAHDVSVVPGNHDAYVRQPFERSLGKWSAYMASDEATARWFGAGEGTFPYTRIRDGVAIIGLSSAVASPPFMAYGRLGRSQIDRLSVVLRRLGKEDLFRVVIIHHPPLVSSLARWKHLLDEKALRNVLKTNGAELLLHGHLHRRSIHYLRGPKGILPIVGTPSASLAPSLTRPSAAYNLCHIDRVNGEWTLEIATRTIKPSGQGFTDVAFDQTSTPIDAAWPPKPATNNNLQAGES